MFRTKKDVERHVTDVLSKIDNENEKKLRGFIFARLYSHVKDYESAKKHLSAYLSVRDHHAPSHKLMAEIFEATKNPESALQSYKRSLEIDPHQNDVVLKICKLYCQVPVDHETARYWADRAEQLYPHHEIVFGLREYLVSAEGEPDRQELENLIASELAAQPTNIDLRIKLLRLYLDTERVKEAYDHATMILSKRLFTHSVDWYYLLGDIFEAYQEENGQDVDAQFYISYLTALDYLIYLTLAEPHTLSQNGKKASSLSDAAAVLLTFDQLLKKAIQKDIKEGSWTYFIHHMKGQLYFHMTCLLMKRAKMDQGNRKEAFRFSSGLAVVCYTFKPINILQEIWFSQMEDNQKTFTNFFQQGTLRTSFIGNVLLSLCKEDKGSWLQKIKSEVCIPQVKERIYNRIFTSLVQKGKLPSSYFITDTTFEQSSLELPTEMTLKEYDKSASKLCSDSLHHMVWLQLHGEKHNDVSHDNIAEIFKNLQYGNKNLSKGSCESLCVLDLEAFLYATVYESKIMLERRTNVLASRNYSLVSLPPHIADALCTKAQASWWATAHSLHNCSVKEKLGEHRRNLQHGLEVIRGIGNHGMEVQLVIHLARTFSAAILDKNAENKTDKKKFYSDHVMALYTRAIHYWNIALGMLEKLSSGQALKIPNETLFSGCGKALSKQEIKELQEEGQLFLAMRLMNSDKLNEAAELLSKLSSPYGSYYLALTLKNLASQEPKYSAARAALLNRSKNALHETMDRIKDDKSHPLNKEIFIELEDVENDLAVELGTTGDNSTEDIDETDVYDGSSVNNSSYHAHAYPNFSEISAVHSTPRPATMFTVSKRSIKSSNQESPSRHFEPSPERLDAQIRVMAMNQDMLVKWVQQQQTASEQQSENGKAIVDALQQFKEALQQFKETLQQNKEGIGQLKKLVEVLTERITDVKPHHKTVPKKSGYLKGQGDDEEDYYDPHNILDYYEDGGEDYRTSGYSFDRSSRLVHDPPPGASAPLNYVVSPALPPGPPPPLNHFSYQYPPHAVLPTPAPAVERPPYYHPPPSQGLPFSEGQQLPQFHFHVASSVIKPPPPPTCLPQVVSALPGAVTIPPSSVVMQPPTAASSWSKPVTVPHAFQIPLPTSVFVSAPSSVVQTTAPVVPSSATSAAISHSQLKDLLQTPVTKTITFGQPLTTITSVLNTSPSIFSGLAKTPETPKNLSRCDSENAASPDIDGHDLEREVMGDFTPLIPLPAEIVVETGEENEIVLFEDRAKLYRFVDQEWKERGIGIVKILHHDGSGRVRLLMRRDQVLKVCANHYITSNMELNALKNSDKAWTWVAPDFADEELRPEHFCIRFKTPEIAASFKMAFDKAVNISKEIEVKKITSPKITSAVSSSPLSHKPFGGKFLPKAGSWTCPTCYVSNAGDKLSCIACDTKKPGSQTPAISSVTPTTTAISLSSEAKSPFQIVSTSSSSIAFGSSTTSTGVLSTGVTSANTEKSVFGGFTFSSKPLIQEAETPEIKDREILLVSTKAKNGPQVTKVSTSKTSPFSGFSFKSPTLTITTTANQTTTSTVSNPVNISISGVQSSVQNISPTFAFSKNISAEKDAVSSNEAKSSNNETNTIGTLTIHVSPEGRKVSTDSNDSTSDGTSASSSENDKVQPLSNLFKPQVGSWECESCLVRNNAELTKCAACESPKPGASAPPSSFSKLQFGSSSSDISKFGFGNTKPNDEFVFGKKAASQPTTFTFGLSGLSNKSNETGIKPSLNSTTNTPAVFGGWELPAGNSQPTSQGTSIFGGTQKSGLSQSASSIFGTAQKSVSSPSSIFGGGVPKSDSSGTPGFGASTPKFESSISSKPAFGNLPLKSEETVSTTPAFESLIPKSEPSSTTTPIFGSLPSKTESVHTVPSVSGSVQKSGVSQSSSVSVTSTPQAVFSFGSSNQGKSESGPVEFRFGSPQKYEFNFSGVRPRSPTKTPKSPRSPATPSDVEDDEENESFDADNIYFQPVIPLPPKVDLKTGEENERTLFCKRAKLFRFCSGEWKERGIGEIKILHDEAGNKIRLLMRRDQVLKVCLNHYLSEDVVFEKRGDKVWQWAVTDFSENEPSPELFAVRLKTSEFADEFKAAIDDALKLVKKPCVSADIAKAASSFSFKTDSPNVESFTAGSLASRFGTASFEKPIFGNASNAPEASTSSPFSLSYKDMSTSSTFFKQPGSVSNNELKTVDDEHLKSVIDTVGTSESDDSDIQVVYETVASPSKIERAKKLMLPPTFFLYEEKPACSGCIGCNDYIPPTETISSEAIENSTSITNTEEETDSGSAENSLFAAKSSISFADLASNASFTGLDKSSSRKNVFEGAGTPLFANLNASAEAEGDEDTVAEGPDIHFEPVIPLPELVTVKTGEEDETPVFKNRAKLFRFDPEKKQWKERGVGDLKILKHNEKLRFRIILRRDQVHKIACNHCIAEDMELSPLATSDSALCWNALDYSESQPEASQFAVRFKNKDQLEQFRESFNLCKELLKAGSADQSLIVHTASLNVQDNGKKDSQIVEVPKSTTESSTDSQYERSGSETNEDDEDSDNDPPLFEKRVSFEISDGNSNEFESVGMGTLKVRYDDTVYGYHVYMYSDSGPCLCEHIIAIQTVLMMDNKKATWAAIDLSVDPPRHRKYRATFGSVDAVKEFYTVFEEGKDAAIHSEIIERDFISYTPSGQQT